MRARWLAISVVCLIFSAAIMPARAAAVPPGPTITLNHPTVPAGQSLQVEGAGFADQETVDLAVGTTRVGTATTNRFGRFVATPVVVPVGTQAGSIQVTATGELDHWTAQRALVIKADFAGEAFDSTGSGSNPFENTLTATTVSAVRSLWTVEADDVQTVADGYVATYDGQRGWTLRRVATGVEVRTAGLALDRVYGSLIISYGPDTVTATNIYTGARVWQLTFPGIGRPDVGIALAGNALYRLAAGGDLTRIDPSTGSISWAQPVPDDARRLIADSTGVTFASGASNFTPAGSPVTFWHYTAAGALGWKTSGYTSTYFVDRLTAGAGKIYLPYDHELVVALDENTGVERWRITTGSTSNVGFAVGQVHVAAELPSGEYGVLALVPQTGRQLWATAGIESTGSSGGLIYSPTYQAIDVFDAHTGTKVTSISLEPRADPKPIVVANGQLYVYYPLVDDLGNYLGNKVAAIGLPYVAPSLEVLDDSASAIRYSGGWKRGINDGDYRGSDHYTETAGSSMTFSFTGTGFRYWYSIAAHHGIAGVSIDGGAETRIDEYATTRRDGDVSWSTPKLAAKTHTVTIRATGDRNAASAARVVTVDRIELGRN